MSPNLILPHVTLTPGMASAAALFIDVQGPYSPESSIPSGTIKLGEENRNEFLRFLEAGISEPALLSFRSQLDQFCSSTSLICLSFVEDVEEWPGNLVE
jgi:hypothetical protein